MEEFTYSAFISYRHMPEDSAAAKAVQKALETYRIPRDVQEKTGRQKLNRCFRDEDELPLANDLGASIEKALRESECLVVICSPSLPQSRWCLREVEYYIELGRRDRIIPVLISGEPKDSYPPQITWESTENGVVQVEPLAADLRGNLARQLKSEKLRIIARILNLDYNDLKKRERERALRRGLILVSAILAGVTGFAAYALYQNGLLTRERNTSARNATELLIEKSVRSTQEGEISSGLAYALQAYEGSRLFDDEYDAAVSAALETALYPELFSQIGSLKDNGVLHIHAALSNDGSLIACRQSDDSLQVYSSVTGERLYTIKNCHVIWKSAPDISPDGNYVCNITDTTVTLYHSGDGSEALTADLPEGWEVCWRGLTVMNEVPVKRTDGSEAGLFDPFHGTLTELDISLADAISTVVLHRSGKMGAWFDGNQTHMVDLEKRAVIKTFDATVYMTLGGYTGDMRYFFYWDGEMNHYLTWDTLDEVCVDEHGDALSPDGKIIAEDNSYRGFTLWDVETGEILWSGGHNNANEVYTLYFANNDTLIASHGQVQIYRISTQELLYDSGENRTTYGLDFAAGRLVMPLRAGGCLINLMPEEESTLPHMTVEHRDAYPEEDLAEYTSCFPLAGSWDGSVYYISTEQGMMTVELDEPGLVYIFNDQEYILHPVNGVTTPFIYVSPDGKWQAMIRGQAVDIFRAGEGPEPVMTIPGYGYDRLCAAIHGDTLALGAYVENLVLFDLNTGDCLGSIDTGAMCVKIQFSADGKHIIGLSAMAAQATVASTETFSAVMRIPAADIYQYASMDVGFSRDGTEAIVFNADGSVEVGLMYQGLNQLVEKARDYVGN